MLNLERIHKFSLYLLVALIPVWFLPITQEVVNFQKQALLVLLVVIAVLAWLAKMINDGEITLRLSWLHLPVLAVVLVTAVSTAFSIWAYGSFWGWPLSVSDSFVTILAFALLYFLISNTVSDVRQLYKIFTIFIVSVVLAQIYAMLQLYGVFVVPFLFAKVSTFNTIGSINIISMISAILLPLTLMMAFATQHKRKFYYLLGILLLVNMLLINSLNSWVVLIAGLLVLLTFGIWNLKKSMEFRWIAFPLVLLILALFFSVFRFSLPGTPTLPLEISPSREAEINILKSVLRENPLIGSGPGTFVYDYAKYHQSNLNQTIFWGTRFTSGASEILDWFVTEGILGGLAFVILIIASIIMTARALIKPDDDSFSWMIKLGLLASFVGITVAHVIYYSNFTLSFIFWMLLGGLGMVTIASTKKVALVPRSFLAIVSSFIFLIILIVGIGFILLSGQKYASEVTYFQGAKLVSKGKINDGVNKVLSAINLNPSVDLYLRDLAQLYLAQLSIVQNDASLSSETRKQQMQAIVNNVVSFANQTIAVNPANIENWNVRGFIFRNLIGVPGADGLAIESYNKAHELEPLSPFSFTELGRVYLALAQSASNQAGKKESLDKALESLNKAIELKSDYAPAHYLTALAYGQQGKTKEGIDKLESTKLIAPNDVGLAFQLGVLYYQRNELGKASAELERAKKIQPNYSNAKYILGLVYDKQGAKDKAIEEFENILELNPENNQVKKILSNLYDGKSAQSGTSAEPLDETPAEIKKK